MNKLTKIFSIGLIGLLLLSAAINKSAAIGKRTFKGDLCFPFRIIGDGYYGLDSLFVKKFDRYLDSLVMLDKREITEDDLKFANFYSGLKKHELIDKPYFYLKIDATTYTVYTDLTELNKIKDFKRGELIKEKKKVQIELTGKIINIEGEKVISCSRIDRVEKVDGITPGGK